ERQVHVVADTSRYPGWVAYPETSWIRSSARAPITREGRVIGFLNVNSMRTDAFSAQDAERLQSFAEQAAVAIHNAQLFAAEQDQRALSDALRDTAAAVSSTLDLDEVLDRILANIGRVTVHDAADIMLIDGDYARIVRCRGYAQRGVEQAVLELSFKIDETYSMCDVLKTGQAQVISDTAEYARWVKMPTSEWIRSHAVAPIKLEEQVIGFLNVDSATPNAFAPEDAERLQAFADQAAIAVRNARLYAETRRHAKDLEQRVMARTIDLGVRNAVAETLSSSLDVAEMLDGVLQTTVEQLGVLGGAIYLLSEDARSMDLLAHTGISEEALSLVTGITPGSTDLSLGHDIAVALSEDALDVRQETGISAVLSVPIMRQEQIQGVITLVHNQPRPWRNEESRMLDAIGRQIGVALANAGLYADAVRREAHIRTILQGVTDGLLVFDQNANLTLINPAAENLFAFYSPSLGGTQHAASLLWTWLQEHEPEPGAMSNVELALPSAPLPSGLESVRAQCVAQECLLAKQEDLSWPCWLAEGISQDEMRRCAIFERVPRRAVQVQSAEVRDAEGQFLGTVVALHDVTYYRELDTLKGQFVSNVSHELRTPLAAVLLQLSTLLKYYDRFGEAERRDILNEIEEQAQLLRELIEGILELSRFDARRKTLQRRWFDLSGECRNVVSALRPVMSEKRLHLDMSRCAAIQYALGDQQQLTQVFRNLLSNAIKYTPEDGRIRVRLEQVGSEVQLAVEDTGVGISQEEQVYVFDRFFRSENVSQMAPGTGLGLSITKEIIDLHEGWIDLHSVLGEGSTFTVHLPLPEDTDKQVRDTRLDVERQGG
ncbi:MAG: GAF domain-containing protein, partial [Anaerolineae bacterium]|nr:GAF domain-containing protein [Anaerolineae bacterium]